MRFITFYICVLTSWYLVFSQSQAKVVRYNLEAYYFSGTPDGVFKYHILGVNGQFPGPALEADVGDTLEITLSNKIQDGQNATIHWHGMHQKGSLFEDGTSQISQCPLPFNSTQVYRFNVTQPGTFWYHSHVNSQYTEGFFGPLIVQGHPEEHKYDGEITIMLSDWYHRTAHENEKWYLSPGAGLSVNSGRENRQLVDLDELTEGLVYGEGNATVTLPHTVINQELGFF